MWPFKRKELVMKSVEEVEKKEAPTIIKVDKFEFVITFCDGLNKIVVGTDAEWCVDFLEVRDTTVQSDGNIFMAASHHVKYVETKFKETVDIQN